MSTSSCSSPSGPSGKQRTRFSAEDEILLFREVLSQESPFSRGSCVWEKVSKNLRTNEKSFSPRLCRDRIKDLIKEFIRNDNKERVKTGVEEEYSERAQLLSELRELYQGEEDKKEETAKAKKRKDADTTMAKDMREACMETYAQSKKRVTQDGEEENEEKKPTKRRRMDVAEEVRKRTALKERELNLREKEYNLAKEKQDVELEERRMFMRFMMEKERNNQ
ncbi:trichohyalin-like [Sycon ciliatum]|uniref:trichohyalin-like n=1 Tax=Sycon ciliatum TaxID=27933 RepID=UPI0031F6AE75